MVLPAMARSRPKQSDPQPASGATASVRPADAVADAPLLFRLLYRFILLMVKTFFREIEVVGLENVPPDRGGVMVSWHPNGLMDPFLITTALPRRVVFGARQGLFKVPLLAALIRNVGSVPVSVSKGRAVPEGRGFNRAFLNNLASSVADGRLTALFPEGISHDSPHLIELKTGAARLYFQARAIQPEHALPCVIIPVGLHYDHKRVFRSRVLVRFHPPMHIPAELDVRPAEGEPEAEGRARARALTSEIGRVLQDVVLATEDWRTHELISRARSLMRAESAARHGRDPGPIRFSDMARGFARIRAGYLARRQSSPEPVERLRERLTRYDEEMVKMGIADHELDRRPRGLFTWVLPAARALGVFVVMPPLLFWGFVVNGPPALILLGLIKAAGRTQSDDASIKILVGTLLFPVTWILAGLIAGIGSLVLHLQIPLLPDNSLLFGTLVATLSAIGGPLSLLWLHLAKETRRSLRVRLVQTCRREVLENLRAERASLYDVLLGMRRGLDLRERRPTRAAG